MYTVIFTDLSDLGPTVVVDTTQPAYDTITVGSMAEAFALAIEYGDEFQVTIVTPE